MVVYYAETNDEAGILGGVDDESFLVCGFTALEINLEDVMMEIEEGLLM